MYNFLISQLVTSLVGSSASYITFYTLHYIYIIVCLVQACVKGPLCKCMYVMYASCSP